MKPNITLANIINTLVLSGKTHGWYAKLNVLQLYGLSSMHGRGLNVIANANNATIPAESQNISGIGIRGATAKFINTGINVGDGGEYLFANNDMAIGCYLYTGIDGSLFGSYDGTNTLKLEVDGANMVATMFGLSATLAHTPSKGLYMLDSSLSKLLKDGESISDLTGAAGTMPNANIHALGYNNNGANADVWIGQLSAFIVGQGLTLQEHSDLSTDLTVALSGIKEYYLSVPSTYEPIDLILLMGQSNASGYSSVTTNLPAGYIPMQTDKLIIKNNSLKGEWQYLQPTINSSGTENSAYWGLEQSLLHNIIDNNLSTEIRIIKNTLGGAAIDVWNNKDGAMWIDFEKSIETLMMWCRINKKKPNILMIGWIQGEADAASAPLYTTYQQKLTTLIANIRDINSYLASSNFIMQNLSVLQTALDTNGRNAINSAFVNIETGVSNCFILDPDEIAGLAVRVDNVHYSDESYLAIGSKYYNDYLV
jgi:hypothetical protein